MLSVGHVELAVLRTGLPLDTHEPVEVHAFRFEPTLEGFSGVGAEFHKHFALQHVDEHPLRVHRAAVLHALREILGALACETSERVLCEITRHCELPINNANLQVFHIRTTAARRKVGVFWSLVQIRQLTNGDPLDILQIEATR